MKNLNFQWHESADCRFVKTIQTRQFFGQRATLYNCITVSHICLISVIILNFAIKPCLSQEIDDKLIQDFSSGQLMVSKDPTKTKIDGKKVSAYFQFSMKNDSIISHYLVSDLRKNGQVIKLQNWKRNQVIKGLDAANLGGISRSENFLLSQNDTLTIYRQFTWMNLLDKTREVNNFYSKDTLDFAIEIVRADNGKRLALLDSFGVRANFIQGMPKFHGKHPIFCLLKFNNETQYSDSIFVRVKLYSRGDGPYYFVRTDHVGVDLPNLLNSPFWIDYINTFGGNLPRLYKEQNISKSNAGVKFEVRVLDNKEVSINYALEEAKDGINLCVYNSNGELVYMPVINALETSNAIRYQFENKGLYYVVLRDTKSVLLSKKVIIK